MTSANTFRFNRSKPSVDRDRFGSHKHRRPMHGGFAVAALLVLGACAGQVVGWGVDDDTAPTVTSTTPMDGASGVALNASISATFSEAMDPSTIGGSSFFVTLGDQRVDGTVHYAGTTAVFTPDQALAPNADYVATIARTAADLAENQLAADYTWEFGTGVAQDDTRPMVIATSPDGNASDVAINTSISAVFSEAMDPATLDGASFTISMGGTDISGSVSYSGVTAVFNPDGDLDPETGYVATITAGAADLAGNELAADYTWEFTTSAMTDSTAPFVTSTVPDSDALDVPLNASVGAVFSEAMNPATMTLANISVNDGSTDISGTLGFAGMTVTFIPSDDLQPDTEYTATISNGVEDLAGNGLASEYEWSFTTGATLDETRPMVTDTTPNDRAIEVAFNTSITATFTEAMAPGSISGSSFRVFRGATPVSGSVSYTGVTATFAPAASLVAGTRYVATITTGATDIAGNALAAEFNWEFTTGEVLDVSAPLITSTTPEAGAEDVPFNTNVAASFNEAMDPATMTLGNFSVADGAVDVAGTVGFAGTTFTFSPASDLDPDTEYTATVSAGVTDLAGNALGADYTWTFTTGAAPDEAPPEVTSTNPADLDIEVAIDGTVSAVFSEPMDPLTVNVATFTLLGPSFSPVLGTVEYSALTQTAVFTPGGDLEGGTLYMATVKTNATDLAGNGLSDDHMWTFTTDVIPDETAPQVTSTLPGTDAMDVPLNTLVAVTFDEPMDPATMTSANFMVFDGATEVTGTVAFAGSTMTFTPSSDLDPDTIYTATVTTDAADLAGNLLADEYTWEFTTGVVLDETPPEITGTEPLDLEEDVSVATQVRAVFSEPMDPLTLSAMSFTLTGPGLSEVLGLVEYDALTNSAIFTPDEDLQINAEYAATVTTEASDLAGHTIIEDYVWTFTTGENVGGLSPVNLGSLTTFVAVAGAGLTNSNAPNPTLLDGDVGLFPTATCMGDGSPCSITNPVISGTLYAADPGGIAELAKTDLVAAFVDAMGRPPGMAVTDISNMVLPPGVYTAETSLTIAVGQTVTLDGQGDPNGVWIFQVGSSITVNNSVEIILINGARAKNVFWAAGASSTLGNNVTFQGTVMASESNSIETGSTVLGRLLCTTGAITLLSNTITLPPF